MTDDDARAGLGRPAYDPQSARLGFMRRRREKIIAEIERNRRGEYVVPTWVLVVCLLALLGGTAALIILS